MDLDMHLYHSPFSQKYKIVLNSRRVDMHFFVFFFRIEMKKINTFAASSAWNGGAC
jgi:hypothetical protein